MRGNILTVHWYHRRRVSGKDAPAFGRMIGRGTVIMGVSVMIWGFSGLFPGAGESAVLRIAVSLLVVMGIVAGLVLIVYSLIRYNRGIF